MVPRQIHPQGTAQVCMAVNFPPGVSHLCAWACNSMKWYKCVLPSSRVPVDSCVQQVASRPQRHEIQSGKSATSHLWTRTPRWLRTDVSVRKDKLSLNLRLSDVMDYSSLEPDLHQLNECFPFSFHISLPTVQRSEYPVHTLSGGCVCFFFIVLFIYMDYGLQLLQVAYGCWMGVLVWSSLVSMKG